MLTSFAFAVVLATVATGLLAPFMGHGGENWIRRIFLVMINLHPLNWGAWRTEFTRREALFACWFLVFLVAFVVGSLACLA